MPQKRKSSFRKSLKKSMRYGGFSTKKTKGQKGGMEKGTDNGGMDKGAMMEMPMMSPEDMKKMVGQTGGMMDSKMEMPMISPEAFKKMVGQTGGSPASSLVMASYDSPPVMNDYVVDPRIPDGSGNDIGGCKFGGGTASDMVMSQLTDIPKTVDYPEGYKPAGNINSLNLYAPIGGAKKNKRSNKKYSNKKRNKKRSNKKKNSKKSSNNRSNKSRRNKHYAMKGGHASDWISSQYSLGSVNGNSMNDNTTDFSNSQGVSRDVLMNPPTLGLAGSGYPMGNLEGANVSSIGAPLV